MRHNESAHFSTRNKPSLAQSLRFEQPRLHRYSSFKRLTGLGLISIALTSPMANAEPRVDGTVISWPDDGWYQVQTSDGTSTLCNGGRSCTVVPGSYLVINHSTGERFGNIVIDENAIPLDINVDGLRISWPDDGWYQVQTTDGGTSVCSGGDYCDVDPGSYLVINHTTGVRFSGIEVSTDMPVSDIPDTINRDNHIDLISQIFSVYTGTIYGETLPAMPETFMESRSSTAVEVTDDMLTAQGIDADLGHGEIERFACDNGGVLDYMTANGGEDDFQIPTWDNCLDDTIVKDGMISSYVNGVGGAYRNLMLASYTAEYPNGEKVHVSGGFGEILTSHIPTTTLRTDSWTHDEFNYSLQNDSTSLEIHNVNTDTSYDWYNKGDDVFTARLEGSFEISSPLTDHQAIDVTTNETLSAETTIDGSFDFNELTTDGPYSDWNFEKGELEITANDGSALRLKADSGDSQNAEITLLQDGVVLETFMQPWSLWRNILTHVQTDTRDVQ